MTPVPTENIQEMRKRHKLEIGLLQAKCPHNKGVEVHKALFETRTTCATCGKIFERKR